MTDFRTAQLDFSPDIIEVKHDDAGHVVEIVQGPEEVGTEDGEKPVEQKLD